MKRLPAPLAGSRGEKVTFTFDGQTLEGFANESLAAAILASGRAVLARSLRFHRPRSMFCSSGECGWCAIEVDGVPNVSACTVPCRDGLIARSQNAWPSAERDIFSLLDIVSSLLPATFYHHRFLRPKFMRQCYLAALRLFTGLGRLRAADSGRTMPRKRKVREEWPIAVVGGGVAGLSAALAAAENSARVVLIDDHARLGGSWHARGEGARVQDLIARASEHSNIEHWPCALCVGFYGPKTLGVVTPEKLVTLHADQIILAPGALDAAPLFVNNDLPGVMSGRLVERLIAEEGLSPGTKAVAWGGGPADRIMALMERAGIKTVARVANDETLIAARGRGKVTGAVIQSADGRRRSAACDLIVIVAMQPRNELVAQAGGELQWDDARGGWVARRDETLATTVTGLSIVGEGAGCTSAQACAAEGRLAGLAAARHLGLNSNESDLQDALQAVSQIAPDAQPIFSPSSSGGAGHVCFCEDVREREIRSELEGGWRDYELLKRRTGIFTGPCQGKFCAANAARIIGETGTNARTTARPPAKVVRLGDVTVMESGT